MHGCKCRRPADGGAGVALGVPRAGDESKPSYISAAACMHEPSSRASPCMGINKILAGGGHKERHMALLARAAMQMQMHGNPSKTADDLRAVLLLAPRCAALLCVTANASQCHLCGGALASQPQFLWYYCQTADRDFICEGAPGYPVSSVVLV